MFTLALLVLTLEWYSKQKHHLCQLNVIYFRYFKYNFILGNFKLISKCLIIDKKWSHVLYESLLKASFEVKSCFLDELFIRVSTTRQKSLKIDGAVYFLVARADRNIPRPTTSLKAFLQERSNIALAYDWSYSNSYF